MTSSQESSLFTNTGPWIRTIPLAELPVDGTGRAIQVAEQRVALFHHEGKVHAVDDACPHQGASLGDGVISNGDVTCPFHSWHFDLCTGQNTDSLDACVAVFPVRVDGDGVVEVQLPA